MITLGKSFLRIWFYQIIFWPGNHFFRRLRIQIVSIYNSVGILVLYSARFFNVGFNRVYTV